MKQRLAAVAAVLALCTAAFSGCAASRPVVLSDVLVSYEVLDPAAGPSRFGPERVDKVQIYPDKLMIFNEDRSTGRFVYLNKNLTWFKVEKSAP